MRIGEERSFRNPKVGIGEERVRNGRFWQKTVMIEFAFGIRVSGIGVRGSGFAIRDSGSGIRDSGFVIRDPGSGIRGSGFGIRDSGFVRNG